jgi:hypothetical protein
MTKAVFQVRENGVVFVAFGDQPVGNFHEIGSVGNSFQT